MPNYLQQGQQIPVWCNGDDLHVAAVFGHQHIAGGGDHQVIDTAENWVVAAADIIEDAELLGVCVITPNAVIALGGEVDDAVLNADALPTIEGKVRRDLASCRNNIGFRIVNRGPLDKALTIS